MTPSVPSPDWRALAREPIVTALLFSLSLHLAGLTLLRPSPGGSPETVVIHARLAETTGQEAREPPPESPPEAASPSEPTPVEAPARPEARALPPLLTTDKPSPTPPLPAPSPEPALDDGVQSAPTEPTETTPTPAPPIEAAARPATADPGAPGATTEKAPIGIPLDFDPTWYLARQVDQHPRAVGKIEPRYPEDARRRGIEGNVKLMLKIDELGRVRSAEVVESHPPGLFDEAALSAFSSARFQPATRDGRPVRYQAYFRVDFKLE